ncbi:crustacyanin-A1 subunit-like [Rhodnius prolixus]|uniref:crustacyanin-A1 subunit-like n=1 Tax=Rhodnius prolixus TaxID=13249 RepID=UPI003D18A8A4
MYFKSLILILTTTVVLVSCGKGRCPTKDNAAVPNWPSISGDWYEFASYGDGTTRLCYKCIKYSISSQEDLVAVKRNYMLKLFNIKGSSQYTVKSVGYRNFILEGKGLTSNLNTCLLDATYNDYLILWSCKEYFFGAFHTESSWILTRKPTETLSSEIEAKIKDALNKQNVDLSWYGPVTQNSCTYDY